MPHSKKNNTSKRAEQIAPCYSGYRRVHELDQGLCADSQIYKMNPELVLVSQDLGNESLTHGGVVSGNNHFSYDTAYNKNCSVQSYRKCDGVLQVSSHMPGQPVVENYPSLRNMHNPHPAMHGGGSGVLVENPVPHHANPINPNYSFPANGFSVNAVECGTRVTKLPERRKPIKVDGNQLHRIGL